MNLRAVAALGVFVAGCGAADPPPSADAGAGPALASTSDVKLFSARDGVGVCAGRSHPVFGLLDDALAVTHATARNICPVAFGARGVTRSLPIGAPEHTSLRELALAQVNEDGAPTWTHQLSAAVAFTFAAADDANDLVLSGDAHPGANKSVAASRDGAMEVDTFDVAGALTRRSASLGSAASLSPFDVPMGAVEGGVVVAFGRTDPNGDPFGGVSFRLVP